MVGDAAEPDDGVAYFLGSGLGVESGREAGGEAECSKFGEIPASKRHGYGLYLSLRKVGLCLKAHEKTKDRRADPGSTDICFDLR